MPPVDEIPFVGGYHKVEEMKETESVNDDGHSNEMPTSAQALVQAAAYRIDLDPSRLKILLQAMKEELVTETWQLNYMDFPSWREMGFPVGLIASIRAVKEEEEQELEQSENTRNKNRSPRSGGTSEYSSELVELKASLLAMFNNGEDGSHKRRISDITMSESFRSKGINFSPKHLNVPRSQHLSRDRSSRLFTREASVSSFLADMPPTAAHRRRSSKTRARSPRRQPMGNDTDPKQKSIAIPICPSRRPTLTDLASLTKGIDDPSEVESLGLESIARSKASLNPADDASLALESMNARLTSSYDGKVDYEKSMATIVTGNLGLGDTLDSHLQDDYPNEEEKALISCWWKL